MLVFAKHQHESAIGIPMSLPSRGLFLVFFFPEYVCLWLYKDCK